jgi:aminoglycoside phosphotransferase (APT) family kinase protein
MLGRMLDSTSLEDYLRLESRYNDLSLIPAGSTNVRVSNFTKMAGHINNDLYSFTLTFTKDANEQRFDLILKTYCENVASWYKRTRLAEDIRKYVREFQTLKSLGRVGFPVPFVYVCETDSFFLGYPFVIMSKEKVINEDINTLDCSAATLARLHNLNVAELEIKALVFPRDDAAFANEWLSRLKQFLKETKHYRSLKKDFDYAIQWLESNIADNNCPQYCLIHGEYHPGHTLMTDDKTLKVIDWEGVDIGDPAFDVGYAYHVVKLMYDRQNPDSGGSAAEQFVSEYAKNFRGDIQKRLEFYKVVGILGVTIEVSSWIRNPLRAYKLFGRKALARAIAYPLLPLHIVDKNWVNSDFLVSYLQYFQEFVETTLKG